MGACRSCWRPRSAPSRSSTTFRRPTFGRDRKSTRLNSSHITISYAVFCLKKKKQKQILLSRKPPETHHQKTPPPPTNTHQPLFIVDPSSDHLATLDTPSPSV